jgi:hypothetical protein
VILPHIATRLPAKLSLANVLEKTFGGLLDEIEDMLEAVRTAIVGVGHLPLRGVRGEVQERSYDGAFAAECGDGAVVIFVHGQDVVDFRANSQAAAMLPRATLLQAAVGRPTALFGSVCFCSRTS